MSKKSFFSLMALGFSALATAQNLSGTSSFSLVLRSDSTTRSALLTNRYPDQSGNQSVIIGSAAWDNKGQLEKCHSLLSFDYGDLPKIIKPEWITNAELILVPVILKDEELLDELTHRFTIRRVIQPWQDSLLNWEKQPVTSFEDQVMIKLNRKKKSTVINVNVTRIVKNMFHSGNYGFMMFGEDSLQSQLSYRDWFASARIENENLRPSLVITYTFPLDYGGDRTILAQSINARDRNQNIINIGLPAQVITPPTGNTPKAPAQSGGGTGQQQKGE
jgi:hypothetical protein